MLNCQLKHTNPLNHSNLNNETHAIQQFLLTNSANVKHVSHTLNLRYCFPETHANFKTHAYKKYVNSLSYCFLRKPAHQCQQAVGWRGWTSCPATVLFYSADTSWCSRKAAVLHRLALFIVTSQLRYADFLSCQVIRKIIYQDIRAFLSHRAIKTTDPNTHELSQQPFP